MTDDGLWEVDADSLRDGLARAWRESDEDAVRFVFVAVPLLRKATEGLERAELLQGSRPGDGRLSEFRRLLTDALAIGEAIVGNTADIATAQRWTPAIVALMKWLATFSVPAGPPGSERLQ